MAPVPQSSARIFRGTPHNLRRLACALQRGELVAVPTETVYGLAADALDARACRRIFTAKGRPANDPLIVHIHSTAQLAQLTKKNAAAEKLARVFWPGPLTLVLPKNDCVPAIVTSGRPSVAVRMPAHPLFLALLKQSGRPLAAPSANPFGYISPTCAEHVHASLGRKIRYILDGGASEIGLESTILDLRDPHKPAILRPGAISARDIARVLRCRVATPKHSVHRRSTGAAAPGMLSQHYSPRTPLQLHRRISARQLGACPAEEAVVTIARPRIGKIATRSTGSLHWLSAAGDLREVARNLFAVLRALDDGRWRRIHLELASGEDGLAAAINDRLTRAAAKR